MTGDRILGWHSLKIIFFFLSKAVRKVKDIFRMSKSSGVLQNHKDEMRVDEVKPVVFSCFLLQDTNMYLLIIIS